LQEKPTDPDLARLSAALTKVASMSGRQGIARLRNVLANLQAGNISQALAVAGDSALAIHYQLWAKKGSEIGVTTIEESFQKLAANSACISDCIEILDLAVDRTRILSLHDNTPFEVHANYTNSNIQSLMGATSMTSPGQQGVGVLHFKDHKAYALLMTFNKTEKDFSPTTMYENYPISNLLIKWDSQNQTSRSSPTGKNLINHSSLGYRILIFARERKGQTFTYLGQANHTNHEGDRPIKMVWQLDHSMPAEMFENCRKGG
jgi:hypothetical protein